eukprot:272603_1
MKRLLIIIDKMRKYILKNPLTVKSLKCVGVSITLFTLHGIFWRLYRKLRSYPPGPTGLPILGNLLNAMDLITLSSSMRKQYKSPITMTYLGFQPVVFLHAIYTINNVFVTQSIGGRPDHTKRLQTMNIQKNEMAIHEIGDGDLFQRKRKLFQSVMVPTIRSHTVNEAHNYALKNIVCPYIDNEVINNNQKGILYPRKIFRFTSFNLLYT